MATWTDEPVDPAELRAVSWPSWAASLGGLTLFALAAALCLVAILTVVLA